MADKTLTVNGQPFTINRDRKAEVSQLTVNGQPFNIDRTAPVIESDPVGNSRPLLSKIVGGASAAYSLRDLNSKQGDTNVVNVRRSGDNLEKVFQAKDVHTIDEWVNGKLENTLPVDIDSANCAGAYSLRKVKADYTGNAVRIRRSTDLIEVNVGFDSEGKVSVNSPVTNVVEPFGIERGSTSATTLGGFLTEGGTNYDAFVVTWYDQSGNNHASQTSHSYQPKIASSGALILDDNNLPVIDDLGNGKFLEFSNFIYDSSDTSYSFFMKIDKQSQTTGNYWLLGDSQAGSTRGGGADRGWKVQQDRMIHYFQPYEGDQNFNHGYSDWIKNSVLSFIAKNDNVTYQLFNNAAQLGSDSTKSSSRYSPIKRIMQASDSNTTNDFQGTLSELIFYDSDQSDNRFKIESNINNYYGLYNDAKELTEDFEGGSVSASSVNGQTFVANGKDGFTVTTSSSATGEGGFTTVANVLAYKISFNAKLNGNTVNIARRINKHGSGAATQLQALTEGFNTYDYASAGSGNYQALTFTCSDNNATFTISDFKISGISRNGFVETWYDQSGNLRHAIQSDDTKQPTIVSNGSVVTLNSKPVITFDGNDNFLEVDGTDSAVAYSFSPSGDMGMFIVSKQSVGNVIDSRDAGGDGVFLQQASSNTTRFRYNASSNNIDVTATRDAQHLSVLTLDGTTLSASVDGGTATTKTVTAGVSTTKNLVLGKAFSGNNSNFVDGEIQEVIFYERKQTHNLPAIKANINNQYQIYS